MPLIKVVTKVKEKEYIFSNYEKLAMEIIPQEQLRSTDHNERLIDMMIEDEARDANPEKTIKDIYKGIEQRDISRILAASKNLTVSEKNAVVKGIYNYLLQKKEFTPEDTKRLLVLSQSDNMSLIDLCARLIN